MQQNTIKLTKAKARKVLALVDKGLTSGLGKPEPGKMCIMAAINYAMGLPHGDNPETCVGSAVRAFDIQINDAQWSSDNARAKGMRREAIAKLGSNTLDQREFSKRIILKVIQKILPRTLRTVAQLVPSHAVQLEQAASHCEAATKLTAAVSAYAAADAAANAANAANAAVSAYAAADAAANAANAANAAVSAAYAAYATRDEMLTLACDLAVEVLVEMKSPGIKWLDLCEES